jgi:hypothetical protein
VATPDVIIASNAYAYRLSSNKNRSGIDFGRCVTENTPSAREVVHSGENSGINTGWTLVKHRNLAYLVVLVIVESLISRRLIVKE